MADARHKRKRYVTGNYSLSNVVTRVCKGIAKLYGNGKNSVRVTSFSGNVLKTGKVMNKKFPLTYNSTLATGCGGASGMDIYFFNSNTRGRKAFRRKVGLTTV